LTEFTKNTQNDTRRLRHAAIAAACLVSLIWLMWLIDLAFDLKYHRFGIFPREPHGLVGIALSPLIHGSFEHVFSNTLPILILGGAFLYAYPRTARIGIPAIYVGSGLGVWLFARSSYHIGASGLTYGLMFFLFVIGVLRRDRLSIAISLTVFFLYGGMVWGIFPIKTGVSFESHLSGAIVGTCIAVLFRRSDPSPPEKRYDWEDETEHIGDNDVENTRRSAQNAKRRLDEDPG
jgi:membrane associated rhomboid family serine protease